MRSRKCFRGNAACDDFRIALVTGRPVDTSCFAIAVLYMVCSITIGAIVPDDATMHAAVDALTLAESGDNFALACALTARGALLAHRGGSDADIGWNCS